MNTYFLMCSWLHALCWWWLLVYEENRKVIQASRVFVTSALPLELLDCQKLSIVVLSFSEKTNCAARGFYRWIIVLSFSSIQCQNLNSHLRVLFIVWQKPNNQMIPREQVLCKSGKENCPFNRRKPAAEPGSGMGSHLPWLVKVEGNETGKKTLMLCVLLGPKYFCWSSCSAMAIALPNSSSLPQQVNASRHIY